MRPRVSVRGSVPSSSRRCCETFGRAGQRRLPKCGNINTSNRYQSGEADHGCPRSEKGIHGFQVIQGVLLHAFSCGAATGSRKERPRRSGAKRYRDHGAEGITLQSELGLASALFTTLLKQPNVCPVVSAQKERPRSRA
jgi:hypothetical protein